MTTEFGKDGNMKWERVVPPIHWAAANAAIIADRHLPCGKRQHMVTGSAKARLVIDNADVIGQDDAPDAVFSSELSHLSE